MELGIAFFPVRNTSSHQAVRVLIKTTNPKLGGIDSFLSHSSM